MSDAPPVLFLIFNRPELTKQVMEQIRQVEPPKLFVGADGPRVNHPGEARRCRQARKEATRVDWDCDVYTLFRDENLGTKNAISSAITWFFENIDEGVILEDDCLPSRSFFRFCNSLLKKYRHDDRVVMVSGCNPIGHWNHKKQSYHFSNYGGIWGWATWSKEWNAYQKVSQINNHSQIDRALRNVLVSSVQVRQRKKSIIKVLNNELDSWGYKWFFARIMQSKLSIVPSQNLIRNIGFGDKSTRTSSNNDPRADLNTNEIDFPLTKPSGMYPDREYDRKWFEITHRPRKFKLFKGIKECIHKFRNLI